MVAYLLEPFQYQFMLEAFCVASLTGTVCAILSCYLILKGWSLMGDAISHAIFPGVIASYIIGIPLAIGAFAAGLLCAIASGWIKSHSRLKEDTTIGIVFTGLFALGLVMFTMIKTDVHLNHVLFGNLLGIERTDLVQSVVMGILTFLAMLIYRKDLLLFCFDAHQARTVGLNATFLYYLLLSLLAATIVSALQAVGVILTVAMLITPGSIAFLLTKKFDRMLLTAIFAAVFSSIVGTYISFFINGSTGACIVLVQALLFVVAVIISARQRAAVFPV